MNKKSNYGVVYSHQKDLTLVLPTKSTSTFFLQLTLVAML